jgi:cell division septum initiation protein DivIVA
MSAHQDRVEDLLASLIREQQQTRDSIASLAEAVAGVRAEVTEATPAPAKAAEEAPEAKAEPDAPAKDAEPEPPVDINQLREAFAAKSRDGKKGELKDLLSSYGAKKLPDLDESQYAEVLQKANAL